MSSAVIENMDQFMAFLAAQPLCQWSAQKQQEISMVMQGGGRSAAHSVVTKKNDNAELAAALSSMA